MPAALRMGGGDDAPITASACIVNANEHRETEEDAAAVEYAAAANDDRVTGAAADAHHAEEAATRGAADCAFRVACLFVALRAKRAIARVANMAGERGEA